MGNILLKKLVDWEIFHVLMFYIHTLIVMYYTCQHKYSTFFFLVFCLQEFSIQSCIICWTVNEAADKRKLVSKWHPTTKGTLRRNYRVASKSEGRRLLKAIASLLSDDDHFVDATSHKVLQIYWAQTPCFLFVPLYFS